MEALPAQPPEWIQGIEGDGDLKDMIVPGRTEMYVLKELELEE